MKKIFLMLGGNIGDRLFYLSQCAELLSNNVGQIVAMSSIYESEPWGFNDPQWFLNQVVAVETNISPNVLLEKTKEIEKQLGRVSTRRGGACPRPLACPRPYEEYQARTMDIDILLYGEIVMNTPELVIPHPRMNERMFVLKPMAEIAPDLIHPVLNRSMEYLAKNCTDLKQIKLFDEYMVTDPCCSVKKS